MDELYGQPKDWVIMGSFLEKNVVCIESVRTRSATQLNVGCIEPVRTKSATPLNVGCIESVRRKKK